MSIILYASHNFGNNRLILHFRIIGTTLRIMHGVIQTAAYVVGYQLESGYAWALVICIILPRVMIYTKWYLFMLNHCLRYCILSIVKEPLLVLIPRL